MKEPVKKPNQWIVYKKGESGGFGEIVGGYYNGQDWFYTVKGATTDGSLVTVRDDEIAYAYEGGSWLAPTGLVGQSAYKD